MIVVTGRMRVTPENRERFVEVTTADALFHTVASSRRLDPRARSPRARLSARRRS